MVSVSIRLGQQLLDRVAYLLDSPTAERLGLRTQSDFVRYACEETLAWLSAGGAPDDATGEVLARLQAAQADLHRSAAILARQRARRQSIARINHNQISITTKED